MDNVAAVIFLNKDDNLLLYLRDNKPEIPFPNKWCFLGGHLEKEETPLQALEREIKEEINFVIKDPKFIGIIDDLVGNYVYLYTASINKKLSELTLSEGQKLGYFSLDEALKLDMPDVLKIFLKNHIKDIFNIRKVNYTPI